MKCQWKRVQWNGRQCILSHCCCNFEDLKIWEKKVYKDRYNLLLKIIEMEKHSFGVTLRLALVGFFSQIMQGVLRKRSIIRRTEQQSCYLHSRQVMGIKDWTLIKFHLSEVSFKKSFQLKVRGDTALGRGRKHNSKWEVSFHNCSISSIYKPTHLFILDIQTAADAFFCGVETACLSSKINITLLSLPSVCSASGPPCATLHFHRVYISKGCESTSMGSNIWKHPLPAFYPEVR